MSDRAWWARKKLVDPRVLAGGIEECKHLIRLWHLPWRLIVMKETDEMRLEIRPKAAE